LRELAREWPELAPVLLKNPSVPADLVDALAGDDPVLCLFAVSHPNAPEALFVRLAKHPKNLLRRLVAESPRAPQSLLLKLLVDQKQNVRRAASRNRGRPGESPLLELASSPKSNIRIALATSAPLSPALVEKLRLDDSVAVREALAQRQELSRDDRLFLCRDEAPQVRREALRFLSGADLDAATRGDNDPVLCANLAARQDASESLLVRLSQHEDKNVRAQVAQNKGATAELLDTLSYDRAATVRAAVALNKATTREARERLARDSSDAVKTSAAMGDLSPETLESLSKEKGSSLWTALAQNPSSNERTLLRLVGKLAPMQWGWFARQRPLPESVLWALWEQEQKGQGGAWPNLLQVVEPPLVLWEKLAPLLGGRLGVSAAMNPKASGALLARLAGSLLPDVRAQVARHPNAPEEAVARLVGDGELRVRVACASRAGLPGPLLERLLSDREPEVRAALGGQAGLSEEQMLSLLERAPLVARRLLLRSDLSGRVLRKMAETMPAQVAQHPSAGEDLLEELAQSPDTGARQAAARRVAVGAWVLRSLARDSEPAVRVALAARAGLPLEVLELLEQDGDSSTRAALANNQSATPELLARLAREGNDEVQRAVAAHAATTPETLAWLSESRNESVRAAVAKNAKTPEGARVRLARDPAVAVRIALVLAR
jgi:hypothetical protein